MIMLQSRGWLTGMTDDGVDDAPMRKKKEHVGIAVEGVKVAARGTSAIVLTSPGPPSSRKPSTCQASFLPSGDNAV